MPKRSVYWGQSTIWDFQIPMAISSADVPPPFNGISVFLNLASTTTGDDGLHHRVWDSSRRFSDADVSTSWNFVKRLSELGYTDNFAALPVVARFADSRLWWDKSQSSADAFAVVLEHVRQIGFIAGAGGCRGVICNMEEFNQRQFTQRSELTTFADYLTFRNHVVGLGRDFVQAIEQGFVAGLNAGFSNPELDLVVVLDRAILSLYLDLRPYSEDDTTPAFKNWANNDELVWLCFVNGMIDGAGPRTTFIDACEGESYGVYGQTGARKYDSFADVRETWSNTDAYSDGFFNASIRQAYERKVTLGFIFWFLGGPSVKSQDDIKHDPEGAVPSGDGNFVALAKIAADALINSSEILFIYTEHNYGLFPSVGQDGQPVPLEYIGVLDNLRFRSSEMYEKSYRLAVNTSGGTDSFPAPNAFTGHVYVVGPGGNQHAIFAVGCGGDGVFNDINSLEHSSHMTPTLALAGTGFWQLSGIPQSDIDPPFLNVTVAGVAMS